MKYLLRSVGVFVCLLCLASTARAQSGVVRGTVKDPSGAVIPGAKATLSAQATGSQRTAQTDADGAFEFVAVPVALYTVEVESEGFKKFVQKDIAVDIGHVVLVNAAMQIGQSSTTVTVEASAVQVETTSTQLGAVVDERAVSQLPLNARDTYQLLQIQPGVQSQLGLSLFYGSDQAGVVSVNGGRGRSNNYTVNGGDGNDLFANLPGVQPSPDAVQEFRVLTNTFDAEYGRNSGAVVNVVTKSGTNNWHGDAFEFFRNDVLNARGFYDTEKPEFRQNQFGGTVGGPIRRDKHFFFLSYEGRRIVKGVSTAPVAVPTAEELAGNFAPIGAANGQSQFSGLLNDSTVARLLNFRCGPQIAANGGGMALANAVAGVPQPFGSVFPNLVIPTQCFDPVAADLLRFVQSPNVPGTNFFQTVPNSTQFGDQVTGRYDWNATNTQKLSVYYYFDNVQLLDPFATFQAAGGNLGNFGGLFHTRSQQLNVGHTWTLGASAVNELHFTFYREAQKQFDQPQVTNLVTNSCVTAAAKPFCFTGALEDPTLVSDTGAPIVPIPGQSLGISPNLGASVEGVPYIVVNGGFSIGNNFEGQLPQTGNTYQFSEAYTKILGKHSMKFGADYRYQQFDQRLYFNINGDYTFNSVPCLPTSGGAPNPDCFPNAAPDPSVYASGNDVGFADAYPNYLLGLPTTYSQGSAQDELVRIHSIYLFAQDSWKLKPNVTLNYGLRWELNTPLTDIGHKVQTFRPGQVSTVYTCQLSAASQAFLGVTSPDCNAAGVTPVGLVVPGDKGVPDGLTGTYFKSFAPRIGLAWSPGWTEGWLKTLTGGPDKTSVRMGFGIFYNPIEQLVLEQFSAEPPFGGSTGISNDLFNTPFVTQSGSVIPNPFNGILNPPRGQPVDWSIFRPILLFGQFPPLLRSQYAEQYNLTIQRQLPGDVLFQIGYVGSQGHRLLATYDLNPGNPQTCLDLNSIEGAGTCGPVGADLPYSIPGGTTLPVPLHLPYSAGGGGPIVIPANTTLGPAGITLVGLRRYSSPLCDPLSGTGCPPDGTPVYSNIFTENTVAYSNYNSLQLLVEKRFTHGLQFQAAYTYSKTIDNASSFENVLNPFNLNATRGLSLFDARHRFVFSYYWEFPVPRYQGAEGKFLNGWAMSGIVTFQSGFPIRITEADDTELYSSIDFESAGQPDQTAPFTTLNPHKTGGQVFNPDLFTDAALGAIGNAPRTICCGPGLDNFDLSFQKFTPVGERVSVEFRADIFNIWNHAQFYDVDGNLSDGGSFGRALQVHDPRLVQFALKVHF